MKIREISINPVSAYDTSFFGHFKYRISWDISPHRSVSRAGHLQSFFHRFKSQIRCIGRMQITVGRVMSFAPIGDFSA